MLEHSQTIWICVAFAIFIIVLDAILACRLKHRTLQRENSRQSRQKSMQYKNLEDTLE